MELTLISHIIIIKFSRSVSMFRNIRLNGPLRTYFSNLDIFVRHFSWWYVKWPYLSPNDCDPRGQNEKLRAKRIFDFLVIEYFKLINFGRIFLVTQWSKRLQIWFLLKFRRSAIGPSIFKIDPTFGWVVTKWLNWVGQ